MGQSDSTHFTTSGFKRGWGCMSPGCQTQFHKNNKRKRWEEWTRNPPKAIVQNLARSHLLIKLLTCFNIYSYLPSKGTEAGSTEIKSLGREYLPRLIASLWRTYKDGQEQRKASEAIFSGKVQLGALCKEACAFHIIHLSTVFTPTICPSPGSE